jgi:hypothetical protein
MAGREMDHLCLSRIAELVNDLAPGADRLT